MTATDAKARAERAVHDVWFAAMCLARDHDAQDIGQGERDDLRHVIDLLEQVLDRGRKAA